MRKYMKEKYREERMVVKEDGGIENEELVREVEKRIGSLSKKNKEKKIEIDNYVGGDLREKRELMDEKVMIGFEGREYNVREL